MRISELCRTSGVAVPTIKYYLREGLLPEGERTSATQAAYRDLHLQRLRVVRALIESGVSIAETRQVLEALDHPPEKPARPAGRRACGGHPERRRRDRSDGGGAARRALGWDAGIVRSERAGRRRAGTAGARSGRVRGLRRRDVVYLDAVHGSRAPRSPACRPSPRTRPCAMSCWARCWSSRCCSPCGESPSRSPPPSDSPREVFEQKAGSRSGFGRMSHRNGSRRTGRSRRGLGDA